MDGRKRGEWKREGWMEEGGVDVKNPKRNLV